MTITGGASEIGAGLVEAFVGQGARVAFIDIIDDEAEALRTRLMPATGYAPINGSCDLTDLEELKATFEQTPR